ncbi:MAG TPA: hypothetical protein VEL74_07310 [Thermoanaerobaculia bacterium]|nr:hypothetical protein [Thermoanaerobaculia bacterium]
MKKKLTFLVLALTLLAGAQLGLFTPATVAADTCQTICGPGPDGCECCSTCCTTSGFPGMICSPGACIC